MDFLSSGALPQSLQAESWVYPLGPETTLAAKDAGLEGQSSYTVASGHGFREEGRCL